LKSDLSYDQLLTELADLVIASGQNTPIVLIDGRAGSGKSTFAEKLQNLLFREGDSLPRIIHMDDLYPGWDGLAQGAEYLQRAILTPLLRTVALTSVWLDAEESVRKSRWLERDGDIFTEYFDMWSAQELDFIAREKSTELASFLLNTTVT